MAMEVEGAHLVVSLIGGPMIFGDAVGGDHYAGAIVAKIAVDEDFFAGVVVQELKEGRDLIVSGAKKGAGGDADIAHAGSLHGFLLRFIFGGVAEIHDDGNAEVLQLLVAGAARLRAAIKKFANLAGVANSGNGESLRALRKKAGVTRIHHVSVSVEEREARGTQDKSSRQHEQGTGTEIEFHFCEVK